METVYIKELFDLETLTNEPCVMALGFFDGVHLGHRELIEASREIAEQKNLKLTVMTFFPHPSNVLPTSRKIDRYLSPLDAKIEIFKELGVEKLFVVKFNQDFAKLAPADFVEKYICGLNGKHVVAGFDFTYGFKGQGNMERILQDGGGKFDMTVVSKKSYKEVKISSSKIRELLNDGAVAEIPHYLGSYYSTRGKMEGESYDIDNRTIVMKMSFDEYMLPKKGVYLIRLRTGTDIIEGLCDLTKSNSGVQNIYIESKERLNLESSMKVEWVSELEVLFPPETDEMVKKFQMVV